MNRIKILSHRNRMNKLFLIPAFLITFVLLTSPTVLWANSSVLCADSQIQGMAQEKVFAADNSALTEILNRNRELRAQLIDTYRQVRARNLEIPAYLQNPRNHPGVREETLLPVIQEDRIACFATRTITFAPGGERIEHIMTAVFQDGQMRLFFSHSTRQNSQSINAAYMNAQNRYQAVARLNRDLQTAVYILQMILAADQHQTSVRQNWQVEL